MQTPTPVRLHPFERAGLGKAPFRFIGMAEHVYQACPGAPIQPGTSCDYCSNGIRYAFNVRSADGKRFKVGCDCIRRVEAAGSKILTDAERALNKALREKRHAAVDERVAAVRALLAADPTLLTDRPHPTDWRAAKGETLRDSIEWLLRHAGRK